MPAWGEYWRWLKHISSVVAKKMLVVLSRSVELYTQLDTNTSPLYTFKFAASSV